MQQNTKALYYLIDLIRNLGPISQTKLSEISGYSKSTVSVNCDRLLKEGYIIPSSPINTDSKRKTFDLKFNYKMGYIVGIGMGATNCRISIFDLDIKELATEVIPSNLKIGPNPVLDSICEEISNLLKKLPNKKLLGVGLGLPAPVRYEQGDAFFPVNMYGWHLFPIKEYLREILKCPVFVDNEANTMALLEYNQLSDKSIKSLMGIKIGTGIGVGLINSNSIYRGENGGVGNLGHIRVPNNNISCSCGKTGCLETLVSVPSIINQATNLAKLNPDSIIAHIYNKNKVLTIDDISNAIEKNDCIALELIKNVGSAFGGIIGQFISFFDPGIVIISGSICKLGPIFLDFVTREVSKQIYPLKGTNFVIRYSKNKGKSSSVGAALLCIDELFKLQMIINDN